MVQRPLSLKVALEGMRTTKTQTNGTGTKSFPVADKLAALGVPVVFSTGYSAQDMRDGYRDRPLLKKPIRYQELVGIFTSLLSGPTLRVCPKAHDQRL